MLNYKLSENEAMRLFFCCDETNQSKIEYWRALVFPEFVT